MLLVFVGTNAIAQTAYTISGIVTDENQGPIKGVTVFISGSQQITATDAGGRFTFNRMAAGNYLVSTKMLGYAAASQAVTIHDKSASITFALLVKAIVLDEVKIGVDKYRDKYLSIFRDQFLGTSANAVSCMIVNPEIIHFNSQKFGPQHIILKADADDLLIIENNYLGYRIKYLLKSFEYTSSSRLTFYDGDTNFEELEGNDKQKKIWEQNRLMAYEGSLMHFLRSVFANTVVDEGFVTNQLFKSKNMFDPRTYVDPALVKFNTLVTPVDSSFVAFKFTALNIVYDAKKAARLIKSELKEQEKQEKAKNKQVEESYHEDKSPAVDETGEDSQLLLHLKEAVIDARGSVFTGYRTFLIRGNWAKKRIGDQLPFEYQPPKTTE